MSARYARGLAAKLGADSPTAAAHREAAEDSVRAGQELQAIIRKLPHPPRGRDLVTIMKRASELAGKYVSSAETSAARAALDAAADKPESIGIADAAAHYGPETAPYKRAVALATRAVGASSADRGRATVARGARRELARDLTHPRIAVPGLGDVGLTTALFAGLGLYAAFRISR